MTPFHDLEGLRAYSRCWNPRNALRDFGAVLMRGAISLRSSQAFRMNAFSLCILFCIVRCLYVLYIFFSLFCEAKFWNSNFYSCRFTFAEVIRSSSFGVGSLPMLGGKSFKGSYSPNPRNDPTCRLLKINYSKFLYLLFLILYVTYCFKCNFKTSVWRRPCSFSGSGTSGVLTKN